MSDKPFVPGDRDVAPAISGGLPTPADQSARADAVIKEPHRGDEKSAPVKEFFARPTHPYSEALLAAMPRVDRSADALAPIPGQVPTLPDLPAGCRFQSRCPRVMERCRHERPALTEPRAGRLVACFAAEQDAA